MSAAKECRICHKGDIYGAKGILLTCGQCKRHTHHSCLLPPMSNPHLILLLKAITGPGAKQFGHSKIWMCPRCFGRNPEAAKKTVIGKELAKRNSTHSSSATPPVGTARQARAYTPSEPVPQDGSKDTRTKNNAPISIDTEDIEVIDSDVEMAPLPSRSTTTHIRRSSSNNMMKVDSDDEIEEVVGPSRSASSSRRTTQAPPRSKGLDSLSASRTPPSQPFVPSSAASFPLLPASLLHTKRPSPNASGLAPASTSISSSATSKPLPNVVAQQRESLPKALSSHKPYNRLVGGQRSSLGSAGPSKKYKPRRRKLPGIAYAHSDSSDGSPDEPEKRPRLDSGGNRPGSEAQLDAKPTAPAVTAADIRAIHAELRAEGLVRPPPMNFYTLRGQRRLNAQSGSTTSGLGSPTVASRSTSQPYSVVNRIPSDDSDIEELPMKHASREIPRSDVKGMQRPRAPLIVPSSEDEEDEKPEYMQRLGADAKGKGRALPEAQSHDSDEEEQVTVKLEVFDGLDLSEKSRSASRNNCTSKKKRSPEPVGMWPQILDRYKRTMEDKYENEDDQTFVAYRFLIVERHENANGIVRKTVDRRSIRRLTTPEREEAMKEGVQLVNTRPSHTMAAKSRQIPDWML